MAVLITTDLCNNVSLSRGEAFYIDRDNLRAECLTLLSGVVPIFFIFRKEGWW